LLNTAPSDYRSPSPDLPTLDELFQGISKKRPAAEDLEADSSSPSSEDERYPKYAKRMRTGPCRDIVRNMEKRRAEKKERDENNDAGTDSE
ncbi:hypothetical protein V5O48_019654, partial [Marasmius crinis-equi]